MFKVSLNITSHFITWKIQLWTAALNEKVQEFVVKQENIATGLETESIEPEDPDDALQGWV